MSHYFKNDLNIIKHNQSNLSYKHQSSSKSYLDDEDDKIIRSIKEKQKLLKQLQVSKPQVKSQGNTNIYKSTTKNNKLSKALHNKMSAKIKTIKSGDKKASSIGDYGLADNADNAHSQFVTVDSRELKDNSQEIPFRFHF